MTEATPLPTDAAASTSASTPTARVDQTVTVPEKPQHYHQYCFHLSPTFNRYCPMLVRDLLRLDQYDAFEGQNIFFHVNHPIKWIHICGIVIEVRDYMYRHVFTLDDGSGMAIECVLPYEQPKRQKDKSPAYGTSKKHEQASRFDELSAALFGKVIEVRGDLCLYTSSTTGAKFLQVHTTKHKVLQSTQQEVAFWTKVNTFACHTLNKPWVLDKQIVRACRREARNGTPQHYTATDRSRSLSTEAGSIQPPLPTTRATAKKTTKWQIKRTVENDEPTKDTERPSARAKRVLPKKWQIKREQYDDEPVEEPPEQDAMGLDGDVTVASKEPQAPTSYTRRHTPRPEPMEVDTPVQKKQPKRWRIK